MVPRRVFAKPRQAVLGDDQWTWRRAFLTSVEILSSFAVRFSHDEIDPEEVADVAYQGYKALVVSFFCV